MNSFETHKQRDLSTKTHAHAHKQREIPKKVRNEQSTHRCDVNT